MRIMYHISMFFLLIFLCSCSSKINFIRIGEGEEHLADKDIQVVLLCKHKVELNFGNDLFSASMRGLLSKFMVSESQNIIEFIINNPKKKEYSIWMDSGYSGEMINIIPNKNGFSSMSINHFSYGLPIDPGRHEISFLVYSYTDGRMLYRTDKIVYTVFEKGASKNQDVGQQLDDKPKPIKAVYEKDPRNFKRIWSYNSGKAVSFKTDADYVRIRVFDGFLLKKVVKGVVKLDLPFDEIEYVQAGEILDGVFHVQASLGRNHFIKKIRPLRRKQRVLSDKKERRYVKKSVGFYDADFQQLCAATGIPELPSCPGQCSLRKRIWWFRVFIPWGIYPGTQRGKRGSYLELPCHYPWGELSKKSSEDLCLFQDHEHSREILQNSS